MLTWVASACYAYQMQRGRLTHGLVCTWLGLLWLAPKGAKRRVDTSGGENKKRQKPKDAIQVLIQVMAHTICAVYCYMV
jgi:hypothetical protein